MFLTNYGVEKRSVTTATTLKIVESSLYVESRVILQKICLLSCFKNVMIFTEIWGAEI